MSTTPAAKDSTQAAITTEPSEARAIAKEAFLWGAHPVAIYHLRYLYTQNEKSPLYAGVNRLKWHREPIKALPRTATTPNATTLYGGAILDLAKEPVVISAPDVKDRYWSIQLYDNYAQWWHLIGSQFNAPGPVRRVVIGPNWRGNYPPDFVGAEVVQSTSDFAGIVGRIALTDDTAEELKSVNDLQDRITVMTLSQWAAGGKERKCEDVPITKGDYPTFTGMETVKEPGRLKGVDFLRWVSLILNDKSVTKLSDSHSEELAFGRFRKLQLGVGLNFDPAAMTPDIKAAIEAGIEDGRSEALAFPQKSSGIDMNGWSLSTDLGYKVSDWTQRSYYGLIAVLGPIPSRSHTGAFGTKDSEGRPLSGEHRYTITFDQNDMPPVTEFWEMPLYDREGYFVDNPIDRYSLNSFMLKRGKLHTENGKLVIYVQSDQPTDGNQRKNWLPAPKEGFQFAARFYGPYGPLIDGTYKMPGVVRVP